MEAEANRLFRERLERARRAIEDAWASLEEPLRLPTAPGDATGDAGRSQLEVLRDAQEAIARGNTQREILTALLDGASALYHRVALFVVKGSAFAGWAGLGFLGEGSMRSEDVAGLMIPAGGTHLLVRAARDRILVTAGPEGPGEALGSALGGLRPREASAAPILVRGRSVAILYGDTGDGEDPGGGPAFEILARMAGMAIERIAPGDRGERGVEAAPAMPRRAARGGGATSPVPPEEAELQVILGDSAPLSRRAAGDAGASEEDRRRLAEARRFAQLLVSELMLYNEESVVQGRRHHDLRHRLGKEIERSRQAFEARLPPHLEAASGYFEEELVRVLAQGDPSLLGES